LVVHALTADARVGGEEGWWAPLVGPGRPLDPTGARVVCFNNLGSCYGTFGPGDVGFPRRAQVLGPRAPRDLKGSFAQAEASLPAPITPWDQARTILLGLDALGIEYVDVVLGGSLGGMIALCLAALAPERFGQVLPVATSDAASPWVLGFNHIGRQAILDFGERGLELARQVAHLSYRSERGLEARQGRAQANGGRGLLWPYKAQTYLEYQGAKLRRRFLSTAYLAQLDAMDHHDLGRRPPEPESHERWRGGPGPDGRWGHARVQAVIRAAAIREDVLFPPAQLERLVLELRHRRVDASLRLLDHAQGHDGFLLATDAIGRLVRDALRTPADGRAA
ncbi:MAG: alpha/beta fold hydrolase, partial [Nannocystaceae bacterium]